MKCGCIQGCYEGARSGVSMVQVGVSMVQVAVSTQTNRFGAAARQS